MKLKKKNAKRKTKAIWIHEFWKKVADTSADELDIHVGEFGDLAIYFLVVNIPRIHRLARARPEWADFEASLGEKLKAIGEG
jgi:hypothetical protein